MDIESSTELHFSVTPEVRYEGNRFRCCNPDRSFIAEGQEGANSGNLDRYARRFVRRLVDDMERNGIIAFVPEYEQPQSHHTLMQGSDGSRPVFPLRQPELNIGGCFFDTAASDHMSPGFRAVVQAGASKCDHGKRVGTNALFAHGRCP